jgi:3D (Asp-Asp-Asp) domain-containing protein
MKIDRSPRKGQKVTLIGILLAAMITVFILNIYFKYSNVQTEAASDDTETETVEEVFVEEVLVDNTIEETKYYLPTEVLEAKAKVRYNKWIEDEGYLPESTRIQKNLIVAAEEEALVMSSTRKTPGATDYYGDDEEVEIIPFSTSDSSEEYYYYSNYSLTAYCATGNACADGVMPSVGYTVASNDPNLWHKWIYIEGYGDYYVHDRGGMASNVIDIFMGSYNECIQFGRRNANIYVYY